MSARSMRKLRGEDALLLPTRHFEDEDEDDLVEADDDHGKPRPSAFSILPDDSEDESDEESHTSRQKSASPINELSDLQQVEIINKSRLEHEIEIKDQNKEILSVSEIKKEKNNQVDEHTEDLDVLLEEFKEKDLINEGNQRDPHLQIRKTGDGLFDIIVKAIDVRALNLDWSMRHALAAGDRSSVPSSLPSRRNNSRVFLFGSPTEGRRQNRPASYVGGGIGMTTYDDLNPHYGTTNSRSIPWPYSTITKPSDWYMFIHADSYSRDLEDYSYIQNTGDPNAIPLFVAHHPYVTDALLQLASILYETNQSENGLSFLKRCIWAYECASLVRFQSAQVRYMDVEIAENRSFFEALRRLTHVSSITGLWQSSLAISQYILAFDPLRDPLDVLAVMDSYALCCRSDDVYRWMIEFVESDVVQIMIQNTALSPEPLTCGLCDMPNWAYSYALALFHANGNDQITNDALQKAIKKFPSVVGKLLEAVQVDVSGRSCRMDWITVLDNLAAKEARARNRCFNEGSSSTQQALQTCDKIIDVFVHLSAKVWGRDDLVILLYENAETIANCRDDDTLMPVIQPAVMRYAWLRLSDWETRIQQLPQEANILDPGLVAQALVIEPNRPRLLRHMQQAGGVLNHVGGNNGAQRHVIAGAPTQMIDPDLPIMELFWRSFLPWNHVQGVRRGDR
ncbi:hypothetical protein ACA910_010703 [Epithemia clementina (nom. ined.)]